MQMYGFLNIMFKFIDEEKAGLYNCCFLDLSEPTFRHKAYEAYKGTRKPMAPELKTAGTAYQRTSPHDEYYSYRKSRI